MREKISYFLYYVILTIIALVGTFLSWFALQLVTAYFKINPPLNFVFLLVPLFYIVISRIKLKNKQWLHFFMLIFFSIFTLLFPIYVFKSHKESSIEFVKKFYFDDSGRNSDHSKAKKILN